MIFYSKKEQNLSEIIEDLPELYITHEIKVTVQEEKKFQIIESIKKMLSKQNVAFSDLDGVKVVADDNSGWWLIRASNTQNCLTARCEGNTLQDFESIKKTLFYYINQASKENLHTA